MAKILVVLLLLFQSVHAFLNTDTNYQKQLTVLKEFDLPLTFLTDSVFMSMKEDTETFKTKHFLKTLENGDRFVPVLQKMMQEAGVPSEFLYLAMTESSFNPYSSSSARAAGIWQFIPSTAKLYRLKNDAYVDERRDPIKSTQAAITYLKYLHDMFGKWYLAALAYNCGEGAVSKAIAKAGSDDIRVLLDQNKKYLPKESRLYIRKILMMSFISNSTDFMLDNGSEHLLNRANNDTFVEVEVKSGTHLRDVAQSIHISYEELKSFNPHLKRGFTSPIDKVSTIYIPKEKQIAFSQNFDHAKEPEKYLVYTTKKGDSLQSIARKYAISSRQIVELNGLKKSTIKPKMELVVPLVKASSHSSSKTSLSHTIKSGDTIGAISLRYGVSVEAIMSANGKKNHFVKVGEQIVIPTR